MQPVIVAAAALYSLALCLLVLALGRIFGVRRGSAAERLRARRAAMRERSSEAQADADGGRGPAPGARRPIDRRRLAEKQGLSSIPVLASLLERLSFSHELELWLQAAGVSLNVGAFVLLILTVTTSFGVFAWCTSASGEVGLLTGIAGGAVPIGWLQVRRQWRIRAFEKQFPDALEMMVNALKSGAGLTAAMQVVADEAPAPISSEFRVLLQQQKLGIDLRQGLADLRQRIRVVDVHLFATALVVQKETGGNLAEVLSNLANVVRDRFQVMGDARTLTAEGRLSGVVLALLPIALALAIFHMAPDYVRFFVDQPMGRMMLMAAATMELVGFVMIRRISNVRL